MNRKGQAALEYLMTYGWALIVVAVVIGILVYVTSTTGTGVTCQGDSKLGLTESVFTTGADGVGFTMRNQTGGSITLVGNCVTSVDGTGITDASGTAECTAGTVANGSSFTVTTLDGPSAAGNVSNATATVLYTTAGGLSGSTQVTCNGRI